MLPKPREPSKKEREEAVQFVIPRKSDVSSIPRIVRSCTSPVSDNLKDLLLSKTGFQVHDSVERCSSSHQISLIFIFKDVHAKSLQSLDLY